MRDFLLTFLQNHHEIYLKKSVEIVKGIKTKAIYHAIKSGDLDISEGWRMDDGQLRVALLNGPEKTKKYMHLLDTRDFPKTAGVLKLEGYASAERLGGKPIHVETASRDEKEDIRNLYSDGFDTNMEKIEELEENVAKKLGLEPDEILMTFPRNLCEGIANKVKIYREGSLDENRGPNLVRIGEIFNGLDEDIETEINRYWSVRLCVPENKREEMYKKIKEIGLREVVFGSM